MTKTERTILCNQQLILAALASDSDSRRQHEIAAEAYKSGFASEYPVLENDEMSEEKSRFVNDVFAMYSSLQTSFEALSSKADIDSSDVQFRGFDGNNEDEYAYARYLVNDLEKWTHVSGTLNSHSSIVHVYKKMLELWKAVDENKNTISLERMRTILRKN